MGRIGAALRTILPKSFAALLAGGSPRRSFATHKAADQSGDFHHAVQEIDTDCFPASADHGDTTSSSTSTTVCSCCEEVLPSSNFPAPAPGTACTHESHACQGCWHQWLDIQLSESSPSAIACITCDNKLHQNDIQAFGSPEFLTRYLNNSVRELLSADPDFRWCTSTSCSSGQIHGAGAGANIFTCIACGHKSCIDCIADWHVGQTCEASRIERAARKAAQEADEAAIEQWEYLKEVGRKRRRGSISDAAAAFLMTRAAPSSLTRDALEEAENTATITRSSKQCPGCTRWIEKTEYVTKPEVLRVTANLCPVVAII